ncbi:MAG: valine--tRNA ligase [Candidatus Dadabacteria bacterium]|nr:valine--tRNA ligase [Candidatus Dadabacteria bacterium]NIS07838.1 valine--tRNA ligase [Candidatus Dadabacteria bacterium]NIY21592.1 valine--tRNA ligase [Candidatus Dadabacteria bacterium]
MSEDLYSQIEKSYNPKSLEQKWYDLWMERKYYSSHPESSKKPFTIVIPPPNVTGSLHIGHALNNTLQDIIIRYKRMKGYDALWVPGMDHAGIATQMIVERELGKENITKEQLGRGELVDRVWKWKAKSGGEITNQLKRLGALPDWGKERFTLDEGLSSAVRKVFVDLYNEGLIYKDKRLVNWDVKLKTAVSDLEVDQREVKGKLWYIKYPVEGSKKFITVATTRPETMLGDTAIAVHPQDKRYKNLIGNNVLLPLTERKIPIIADEYSDPEKGSGAVKITPAHDFNDFEVGRRHDLEMIDIFTETAVLNSNVPEKYEGLNRFKARDEILKDLEELGLLEKDEDIKHFVPYGDRSAEIIEPRLTFQWYVDAKELAKEAIKSVEDGSIKFHPKYWENTYFEWMRNIEPWCISRQIWWGHQVPVWYGPDGEAFVELTEEKAIESAKKHYGEEVQLKQDTDVLDTWFSSGLWPFSTLGWPEKTDELNKYYPTSVLITGFDIIFFWVARMIMMGIKFTGEAPFKDIYIHGLIRDEKGEKMSKTRGNVIDPLEIIDEYGADSLRFSLAAMASQGRDIKLSMSVIKGYRNFINKIWNASRFLMLNLEGYDPKYKYDAGAISIFDKWILTKLNNIIQETDRDYDNFDYDKVANKIYQFIWGDFCDWYIEISKSKLRSEDESQKRSTQNILVKLLTSSLQLIHPFSPFITEEIFSMLKKFGVSVTDVAGEAADCLVVCSYPAADKSEIFSSEYEDVEFLKQIVVSTRNIRAELGVKPSQQIKLLVNAESEQSQHLISQNKQFIHELAKVDSIEFIKDEKPKNCVSQVLSGVQLYVPVEGLIDIDSEISKMNKEIEKIDKDLGVIEKKLNNKKFIDRAPADIVEKEKGKFSELSDKKSRITENIARLSQLN